MQAKSLISEVIRCCDIFVILKGKAFAESKPSLALDEQYVVVVVPIVIVTVVIVVTAIKLTKK